jgi:hypothetical protein
MMFTRSSIRVWAVLGLFGLLAGCSSDSPPNNNPPVTQPDLGPNPQTDGQVPNNDKYTLSIVGQNSFTLTPGQQATLKVAYMKNETLLANKVVTFTPKGDAKDTVFTTFTAITDNLGVASTTVAAGQALTSFQVVASAPQANSVTFSVQVVAGPVATPKIAGVFTVVSNFDVTTQFTGTTMGDVLNVLEEMSNHSDDPGHYIVDIIFDEAFKGLDPTVQKILNVFRPVLYTQVQSLLMKYVPTVVTDVKTIAKDLSDLARRFQVTSSLIAATEQSSDQPMTLTHKLEKIGWTLNDPNTGLPVTKNYAYADLGLGHPQQTVQLTLTKGTALSISSHSFPLQFGSFLLAGLNELVIPLIQPGATSFATMMAGWISCTEVGKTIDDNTNNLLGATFWKSACDAALKAAGVFIESQIAKINVGTSGIALTAGTCQITDQNNDLYLDTMASGLWTGTFTLGSGSAPITGAGNNFTGTRTK